MPLKRRLSSILVPSLVVIGLTVFFALVSLHYLGVSLKQFKEKDLEMHADRVGGALQAQIFERYADSQAFALNPNLVSALSRPSAEASETARATLDRLVDLYKVYQASVLTDLRGEVVAMSSRAVQGETAVRDFPGVNADFWNAPSALSETKPQTVIQDFSFREELEAVFGPIPVEVFSSPVYSAEGRLLGVISNYTAGFYVEREMNVAIKNFDRLGIPLSRILLSNESGTLVGAFSHDGAVYPSPAQGADSLRARDGELAASYVVADGRLPNIPRWKVEIVVDKKEFFADVERLKMLSYLLASGILIATFYAMLMIYRYRIGTEREALLRIQESQELERARLSREVHDELGQTITAIKIQMSRTLGKPEPERAAELEEMKLMIEEACESVRRISHDLHPSLIQNFGLESALRWRLEQAHRLNNLRTELRIGEGVSLEACPDAMQTQIYRIFQEALANVFKHARATQLTVSFERVARGLVFKIQDDGIGFERNKRHRSLGIQSIRERAQLLGGFAAIESLPGRGTGIVCHLPYDGAKEVGHAGKMSHSLG